MWVYEQKRHRLLQDGQVVTTQCYAGHAEGKNNPSWQGVPNMGPIPQGRWRAVELIPHTALHGDYVIRLAACDGTDTYDRSGFLIHGDSVSHPGQGSEGCICAPRGARMQLWESGDHDLEVIEGADPEVVS